MESKFKREFQRRLFSLRDAINDFESTGVDNSILPKLFALVSFVWCNNPKLR